LLHDDSQKVAINSAKFFSSRQVIPQFEVNFSHTFHTAARMMRHGAGMGTSLFLAVAIALCVLPIEVAAQGSTNGTTPTQSPGLPEGDKRLTVVVVVRKPFAIYTEGKTGNAAFSGFIIDLFREVKLLQLVSLRQLLIRSCPFISCR